MVEGIDVDFINYIDYDSLTKDLWLRLTLQNGMKYYLDRGWGSDRKDLPQEHDLNIFYHQQIDENRHFRYVGSMNEAIFNFHIPGNGRVFLNVAGHCLENCQKTVNYFKELFPVTQPDDRLTPFSIWSKGRGQGSQSEIKLEVPSWESIRENYNSEVIPQLDKLMDWSDLPGNGKLILWHGEPGTGKTFAIRALANEWKSWCEPHYITDPELFFGSESEYMLKVAMGDDDFSSDDYEECEKPKAKLIILEDVGEMVTVDAKKHVGQAVSRLLNMSDGILGQGLRSLYLLTVNEDMGELNPAILRPGRCAAQSKFDRLSCDQAHLWASKHGLVLPRRKSWSIAELYNLKIGGELPGEKAAAGFRSNS